MTKAKDQSGKPLEILVSSIERALARNEKVLVESPKFLRDRVTGKRREHDVVITLSGSHHSTLIAIECRDRSRKITVNDVEGFWSKCQDTNIDSGILVSPKGFWKTALVKARHYGIRCLELSEASSFNWLATKVFTVNTRSIENINWIIFLENDPHPKPTSFVLLSLEGNPIDPSVLSNAAFKEFEKSVDADTAIGSYIKTIEFQAPGFAILDEMTGSTHIVSRALVEIRYVTTEVATPFNLVTYSNGESGSPITDAAVAEVDFAGNKGQLIIVHPEQGDGQILFVPEKAPPA